MVVNLSKNYFSSAFLLITCFYLTGCLEDKAEQTDDAKKNVAPTTEVKIIEGVNFSSFIQGTDDIQIIYTVKNARTRAVKTIADNFSARPLFTKRARDASQDFEQLGMLSIKLEWKNITPLN